MTGSGGEEQAVPLNLNDANVKAAQSAYWARRPRPRHLLTPFFELASGTLCGHVPFHALHAFHAHALQGRGPRGRVLGVRPRVLGVRSSSNLHWNSI